MRLIDADALLCEYLERYTAQEKNGNLVFSVAEIKQDFADILIEAPTIDAVEAVHGRWVDKGWDGDFSWQIDGRGACWKVFECSACGSRGGSYKSHYCPNCGAKMDAPKDGE